MTDVPADIVDACPECDNTDVTDSHGGKARYQRPRYFCYGCGARFENPRRYDTVTEEYV